MIFQGETGLIDGFFGKPRIDFHETWQHLKKASLLPVIITFLITPIGVAVRSHRWILLLKPVCKVKLLNSFSLQMVGYFTNSIFPLRIGEIVRGVLLGRRANLPKSTAISTIVVERLLDVLSLLAIFTVTGFLYELPKGFGKGALILGIFSLSLFLFMIYLAAAKNPLDGFIGKLIGLLPEKISLIVSELFQNFVQGFSAFKSSKHLPIIAFETALLWFLYGYQAYIMMAAFGFTTDYPLVAASPLISTLVILSIFAVALAIPSAPAGVGTFHAAVVFTLALFDIPAEAAAGYAVTIHFLSFSFYIGAGFLFMGREGLHIAEIKSIGKSSV